MPLVKPLEEEQLDADLREFVQFFKGPLGVVPNSVRTMAYRPAIAKAFTDLNIAVMTCEGKVEPELKRLIGYVTSFVTGCRYCQAHTILGSERFGSTEERLQEVWNFEQSTHFSDAEKAALALAYAASEIPNGVDDAVMTRVRAHWGDEDIVEIMGVIALFGYLNRWNDSMGTSLEDLPITSANKHLGNTDWEVGKHK